MFLSQLLVQIKRVSNCQLTLLLDNFPPSQILIRLLMPVAFPSREIRCSKYLRCMDLNIFNVVLCYEAWRWCLLSNKFDMLNFSWKWKLFCSLNSLNRKLVSELYRNDLVLTQSLRNQFRVYRASSGDKAFLFDVKSIQRSSAAIEIVSTRMIELSITWVCYASIRELDTSG